MLIISVNSLIHRGRPIGSRDLAPPPDEVSLVALYFYSRFPVPVMLCVHRKPCVNTGGSEDLQSSAAKLINV